MTEKSTRCPTGQAPAVLACLSNAPIDACVEWPYARNIHGYGTISWEGRHFGAHRLALIWHTGEEPVKRQAAHQCGNRLCVNVRHLRWLTQAENEVDKRAHGTVLLGEKNPASTLPAEAVAEMRSLYASGKATQTELGRRFGCSQQQVSRICSGTQRLEG